jgi:hypothetical protein
MARSKNEKAATCTPGDSRDASGRFRDKGKSAKDDCDQVIQTRFI